MRFGKRQKSAIIWGRRARSETAANHDDAAHEPEDVPTGGPPSLLSTGDPTQALLTVLGRFQRQYLRAKEGARQSAWSDDCMNALIDAVDIAIAQRWQELVHVLTETARILQTYEDAQRANDSVDFLADSHEILCQMVADLITGEVRPGLMRKWRGLYERVLESIQDAGLALVQDEVPDEEFVPALDNSGLAHSSSEDVFGSDPIWEDQPAETHGGEVERAWDTDDDRVVPMTTFRQSPVNDTEMPFDLSFDNEFNAAASNDDIPSLEDLPDVPMPETAGESGLVDCEDGRIISFPGNTTHEDDLQDIGFAAQEPEVASLPEDDGHDLTVLLDAACEDLAHASGASAAERAEAMRAFEEHVTELGVRADAAGWDGASAACRAVHRLLEMQYAHDIDPPDRFFELAYAFGGVFVESRNTVHSDEYREFQAECVSLMQEWMDSIYESQLLPQFEAPDGAAAEVQALEMTEDAEAGHIAVNEEVMNVLSDEPQEIQLAADIESDAEENIEALLKTAQAAVVGGHRADAKLLVLKAAVRIARQQEDEASERVSQAENELRENELSLDAAHSEVRQFEQSVERAAENIAGVEQSREAERREIESLNERIRHTQTTLSEIDAQIRELQARRAEADNERQQIQETLKAVADRDASIAAEVESLRAAEHEERVRLEETRQRAKGLQTHRTALERRMMEAREALARQRQSTQDIELTIEHIRESEAGPASGAGDMLF